MNIVLRTLLIIYHWIMLPFWYLKGRKNENDPRSSTPRPDPRRTRYDTVTDGDGHKERHERRISTLDRRTKEVEELRKELARERREAQKAEEDHQAAMKGLKARLENAERNAKQSEAKMSELERANARAEKERRSVLSLLETRSAELREAQVFLSKDDDVTDMEILRNVKQLNSKIFHVAVTIADSSQLRYASQRDLGVLDQASQRLERDAWLDALLLSALRSLDHAQDSTLVQTALQAGLVMYVRWLATSWTLGQCDSEGLLYALYVRVKEHEPQSVAGRWRTICRTNVKALTDKEDMEPRRHTRTLTKLVVDVLLVCGVSGTHQGLYDAIKKAFGSALHDIVELALEFHRLTGEVVVSRDLITTIAAPGVSFDRTTMEDDWADPKDPPPAASEQVLCTTQLGLIKEEGAPSGRQAGATVVPRTLLLKPKVVLKSMLEQLWSEHASRIEGLSTHSNGTTT